MESTSLRLDRMLALVNQNNWTFFELLILKLDQLGLSPTMLVRSMYASRPNAFRLVALQQKPLNEALVVNFGEDLLILDMVLVTLVAIRR